MSELAGRDWSFYVKDMIEFCEKVIAYTDGLEQTEFVETGITYVRSSKTLEL